MVQIISKETLAKKQPQKRFKAGVDLREQFRLVPNGNTTIAEFIGTGDFSAAWFKRQRYEIAAGRDEEPVLYDRIYTEVVDPSLPELIDVYQLTEGGVVVEKISEGGEVKFVSLKTSNYSVRIEQYGFGLEYTKKLIMFNQLFRLPVIERSAGKAMNAWKNDLALRPIIQPPTPYEAANITDASTLGLATGLDLQSKYLLTIEAAITASMEDATNPRNGPYKLLVAPGNKFSVERALSRVAQTGTQQQSSAIDVIEEVIVYGGWNGVRGKKTKNYPGVPAGTAFLINMSNAEEDFQMWTKQDWDSTQGNADVSRFILEQTVWDTWIGAYCAPKKAVQKILWP